MRDDAGQLFVYQEGNGGIGSGFNEIEGDDHRHQHLEHHVHRSLHKDGGENQIAEGHDRNHHHNPGQKRDNGAAAGFIAPVQKAGHQSERSGCQNVHDHTDDGTAGTYGKALDKADHYRQSQAPPWPEQKSADKNGDIGGIVLQKGRRRENGETDKIDQNNGNGGHEAENGDSSGALRCSLHAANLQKIKYFCRFVRGCCRKQKRPWSPKGIKGEWSQASRPKGMGKAAVSFIRTCGGAAAVIYRRSRNRTGVGLPEREVRGLRALGLITAGGEFHPALKQNHVQYSLLAGRCQVNLDKINVMIK